MDVDAAHRYLTERLTIDPGKFYGSPTGLHLGVGQLYAEILFPLYASMPGSYLTVRGLVYVLTHECDIDQRNVRPFNTHVLICPIIKFEEWAQQYQSELSTEEFLSFLGRLANREVSRVHYIPHISQELRYGGLLYLNQITNTHVEQFGQQGVVCIGTVSAYGLEKIDQMLRQHLLRPKDEALPLSRW